MPIHTTSLLESFAQLGPGDLEMVECPDYTICGPLAALVLANFLLAIVL